MSQFIRWPLFAAAAFCFASGIALLEQDNTERSRAASDAAAASITVIGAMLAGAWIYASGSDEDEPPEL